jgi:hypothetical protein
MFISSSLKVQQLLVYIFGNFARDSPNFIPDAKVDDESVVYNLSILTLYEIYYLQSVENLKMS